MFKEIKRFISSHKPKPEKGLDVTQIYTLPEDIRRNLIHGNQEEYEKALSEILERKLPFNPDAMMMIVDMRSELEIQEQNQIK